MVAGRRLRLLWRIDEQRRPFIPVGIEVIGVLCVKGEIRSDTRVGGGKNDWLGVCLSEGVDG